MKIERITLFNIQAFDGLVTFDFDDSTSVMSVSGKNGAGKSTLLKVAYLIQKAHFSKLLGGSELFEFKEEALRYLVSDDSYITLKMKEGEQSSILKLSIENGMVELHCDNENFINQHWNLESPYPPHEPTGRYC
ncbi:ATP-binding protein [Photobacterium leiognathi subsp. mandapamensis]